MNKIQVAVNAVLAVAVVALFVLFFTCKPKQQAVVVNENGEAVALQQLPIAYLNLDSLLANYQFAIDANDKLLSKQEDARVKLNTKMRTFQNEYEEFQRKLNNNAFMSRERAESEAAKLQRKQQELEQLDAQLSQEYMEENQKLVLELRDSIDSFLAEYNADGRFQLILANQSNDNVLQAAEGLNITEQVIAELNKRYRK